MPLQNARTRLMHHLALSAFAVAQPLFAVYRGEPSFFVTRRAELGDLLGLALILLVAPPLLTALVSGAAARISPKLGHRLDLGFVGGFGSLIALPLAARVAPWGAAAVISALAGIALAAIYTRSPALRQLLTIAAVAPAAFLLLFLLTPPLSKLILPTSTPAGTRLKGAGQAPVVIVVFDAFPVISLMDRGGNINGARFPRIAELAASSFWFPEAVTTADQTKVAVPSLLTGKVPAEDKLPILADHPDNLFTLLQSHYSIRATEPFTLLAPETQQTLEAVPLPFRVASLVRTSARLYPRILLPGYFEGRDELETDIFGEFVRAPFVPVDPAGSEEEILRQQETAIIEHMITDQSEMFRRFISSIGPEDRHLYLLHIFLPHQPYRFLPSGATYEAPLTPGQRGGRWHDQWLATQAYQRHLLQAKRTDGLVGELIDHLEGLGIFDESLVVLVADHGAAYRDGAYHRRLTEGNVADIALVPMVVKAPHQREGRIWDNPVSTLDLLPAITELVGVEIPWEIDGVSPFSAPAREDRFEVRNQFGRRFLLEDSREERLRGAVRLAELFGDGRGAFDLFAFGPHLDLVGRSMDQLPVAPGRGRVELRNPGAFDAIDPGSGDLPAYLEADVSGVSEGAHIVVVLNGTVATVVPVQTAKGGFTFNAVLPDHLFQEGANQLSLYEVRSSGQGRVLLRLRS